jgi:serine/threonine protein kinase
LTLPDRESGIPDVAGRILPGGLHILKPMGSTPEGTLYHAEYRGGPEVAVLVGRAESSAATASRRAWLERAVRIQHVNVARMLEVGELDAGSLYVVLERVAGEPLSELLAARPVFPLPEALDLGLQVAAGLRAAHQAGFVHGNLSPGTILVTGQAYGRVQIKVIGFGLDHALRQPGGTLPVRSEAVEYASPERLDGHPADEQGDVYSLGAILHRLVTGVPPERGAVDRSAPRAVRDVLGTAVASDPTRRFQSVSELLLALERLAESAGAREVPGRRRGLERGLLGAGVLALLVVGVSLLPRAQPPPARDERGTGSVNADTEPAAADRPPHIRATPPTPVPSPPKAVPTARPDTMKARARPDPRAARPDVAQDPDRPTETGLVATPPPPEPPPTLEDRAQVYLRIGLDEARRQLGRPAHAIEGMSPLLYGLALTGMPPFTDSTRPVVRSVYLGPNESLILLDQQRIRPGARVPVRDGNTWRIGDVVLRLHGEARPEVLADLAKRVR